MESYLLHALCFILIYMTAWFILALILKNNSIVDIAWGVGFVSVSWWIYLQFPPSILKLILVLMVTLWGIRLSAHILIRAWGKPEDWRYRKWREDWGKIVVPRAFLQVFMLQGSILWIVVLPVLLSIPKSVYVGVPERIFFVLGGLIWLVGFLTESIADYQLAKFKADPQNKGKIMRKGLWSISRHPNYLGEIILWWGIFIYTVPFLKFSIAIVGPLILTYLLMRVSGVPMLESKYKDNPEYAEYIKNTPSLFPLYKRKEA